MQSSSDDRESRLIPIDRWPEFYPWPSPAGLRHLAFYAETNGFKQAFPKVGRRRLVDERAFFECARNQQRGQKNGS